ncbi:MAG: LysM domain-containing protein [Verrucomicrobiales bacterium]|nr:LysM domain-containing protein [Verrucomicrobiales bacterium]
MTLLVPPAQAQRAEDIIFTPEKIKTIPGHGMSKGEYPYDEDGYYRKEWVSVSAKSPVKSSTTVRQPIPISSDEHSNYAARNRINQSKKTAAKIEENIKPTPAPVKSFSSTTSKPAPEPGNQVVTPPIARVMSDSEAKKHGFIGPWSKMGKSSHNIIPASLSLAKPRHSQPPTTRASVTTVYHKVHSGDTLFNISRKYGVTVDALKKANGLTSDLIRVGQSLRLALAQHALGIPQG